MHHEGRHAIKFPKGYIRGNLPACGTCEVERVAGNDRHKVEYWLFRKMSSTSGSAKTPGDRRHFEKFF